MTSPTRTDYRGDRPSALALHLAAKARETRDQVANRHARRFTPWLFLCLALAIVFLICS